MGWQWFHRLGSPRWFYEKTSVWMPWLSVITFLVLATGTIWGLGFAPTDFKQGHAYRIIFIHVPGSVVSMGGYIFMAVCAAVGLIWRMKLAFMVMKSTAPIGAILTFICLVTGSIWGKPMWGTWWEWDARITFVLILFFLYLGIIALQEAFRDQETADKTSAIMALVGSVNIPIIYKSVDWWYSLHQPATIKFTEESTITADMLWPLFIMVVGFYLAFATLVISRSRLEILKRERKTRWVEELVMNTQKGRE